MSTNLHSLFDAIQRGDTREIAAHIIPQTRSNPGTVSASLQQKGLPTAGIGTADAGTPIVRCWTVRYRYAGSRLWNYTHVIACDPFKASMVVSNRMRTQPPCVVEVVREIDHEEYEYLTTVSA